MSVDGLLLKLCVWYKSGSITSNNDMYVQCHQSCSGLNKQCSYYVGKQEYLKAQVETCERLNARKQDV